MADTPREWLILEATQSRLQTITVANGYRTEAGADVRLEDSSEDAGTRITLYCGTTVKPDDAQSRGEREFVLIAEAQVPTDLGNAQQQIVALAEDIEDALHAYVPQPAALPLAFSEKLYLDSPAGVAARVVQIMFTTRYRR